MRAMIRRFIRDEEAATAIEYAMIAGLMATALALAFSEVGTELKDAFTTILAKIKK